MCLAIVNAESSRIGAVSTPASCGTSSACLLGAVLAPILLVALANAFHWRVAFYVAGILS